MESGNCETEAFFYDVEDAISFGEAYATSVGCVSTQYNDTGLVECLRALTLAQVIGTWFGSSVVRQAQLESGFYPLMYPVFPWGPCIDGSDHGLKDIPYNLIRSGNFSRVPVIVGSNFNEGSLFLVAIPFIISGAWFPLDQARVELALGHFFNTSTVEDVLALYYDSGRTWESVVSLILRDYIFLCPTRRVAVVFSSYKLPTYLYHFTFIAPNWVDQWLLGSYHSSELEFVFSNPWPPIIHPFDESDKIMAATFGSYWSNFAYTHHPDKGPFGDVRPWYKFASGVEYFMEMNVPTSMHSHFYNDVCEYWDRVETKV
eukprot:TRINITY_DN12655_c0_g1_i2.p1 TRINITY_DN12655_c0_g1~~TRINITY_DN12655_c0_g1_i2.p1  ORF type:complete len:316 (-),score=50.38 TRINITY_DN12655_c0_g1_i2:34-981(-)